MDHWCSVVPEKSQPSGQASFPTGTVGPRVGIFLEPLNTNDRFYLFHMGKSNGKPDLVCENIYFQCKRDFSFYFSMKT